MMIITAVREIASTVFVVVKDVPGYLVRVSATAAAALGIAPSMGVVALRSQEETSQAIWVAIPTPTAATQVLAATATPSTERANVASPTRATPAPRTTTARTVPEPE